jgi:glycine/D-amino acid oxidase-like deaminating enzyme
MKPLASSPSQPTYDVVIVGGAVTGSAVAWFLSANPDFDGSVLVIEKDPSYELSSTGHTNSCMRQQFSNELNVRISQFAADFVRDFQTYMGDASEAPELHVNHYGYMYLADTAKFAERLRHNQELQAEYGAGTQILAPDEIAAAYPFYNLDGIVCGSHNLIDEGYFDSGTMFDQLRRNARVNGVEYLTNEVIGVDVADDRVQGVTLASGETVSCGTLVNAAGPRAVRIAEMAGLHLPVEPRKRFTFIFDAAEPLDRDLPLTIDPSGVHVRSDGDAYMAGCAPDHDPAVPFDDFSMDQDIFEDKVWPALANRIPAFERVKVISRWAGHYAHNTFDQNVIVGPHHEVSNFVFVNGFSGHGMQQSPAMGRGASELITYGDYRTLDLSPLGYERLVSGEPFVETAII